MGFGAFIGGMMQGYQVGQNLQDQKQRREIESIKLKELQDEAGLKEKERALDAAAIARLGVQGQPQPQNDVPGAAPDGSITVQATEAPAASGGVQTPVGLPAGVPGQGEMRPSAMEAGGATQAAEGTMTAQFPKVTVRPKADPAQKTTDFYKARIDAAHEQGDHRLIKKATADYAAHLVNQSSILDTEYKESRRHLTEALKDGQITAETRDMAMAAEQNRIKAMGSVLWLWENGFKDHAIRVSQHAGLGGEGWQLKDFQPTADGKINVIGSDGKVSMTFTPEQARAIRSQSGIGGREEKVILPDGAKLVGKDSGKEYVTNDKDSKPNPERANANIKQSNDHVDGLMKVKRDALGNLMAGITPDMEQAAAGVKIVAARYVRQGMAPEDAAKKAVDEYEKASKKPADAKPAPASPAAKSAVDTVRTKYGF